MSEVKQIWIASKYSHEPSGPYVVTKETKAKWFFSRPHLWGSGVSEDQVFKDGRSFDKPFASEADALSFIADIAAMKRKSLADKRIRDAAPELLAALERLYDAVDSATELTPQVLEQARAAIARAKGGE